MATSTSKLSPESIVTCKQFELEDTEALACSAQVLDSQNLLVACNVYGHRELMLFHHSKISFDTLCAARTTFPANLCQNLAVSRASSCGIDQ